jgi:hypothetical protein
MHAGSGGQKMQLTAKIESTSIKDDRERIFPGTILSSSSLISHTFFFHVSIITSVAAAHVFFFFVILFVPSFLPITCDV